MSSDTSLWSIDTAGAALRVGDLTCVDLTRAFLERIQHLQPILNCYIEVTEDLALTDAAALDAELREGRDRGPLHGIPLSFKDLIDVAGIATTMGSRIFQDSAPQPLDAGVVRQLRLAGAVCLGKNSLAEFAADGTGRNAAFGSIANPWDPAFSPGGSSGGTAASVAAGLCLGGIGSDTGASLRVPASVCGIVGLRPTTRLLSSEGVFPRAYTLDTVGPMARTVRDAAILLETMVEEYNPSRRDPFRANYVNRLDRGVAGMRIGVVEQFTFHNLDPDVELAVRSGAALLEDLGAELVPMDVPALSDDLNHEKLLDLLLYEFHQIHRDRYRNAVDKDIFGPTVRNNLERGSSVTPQRYAEALDSRPRFVAQLREAFTHVEVLLTPTMPFRAARLDADFASFDHHMRRFLLPTSFVGLPSVSLPCGFDGGGMPVGLQLIGDCLDEASVLQAAAALEAAAGLVEQLPPLVSEHRSL